MNSMTLLIHKKITKFYMHPIKVVGLCHDNIIHEIVLASQTTKIKPLEIKTVLFSVIVVLECLPGECLWVTSWTYVMQIHFTHRT